MLGMNEMLLSDSARGSDGSLKGGISSKGWPTRQIGGKLFKAPGLAEPRASALCACGKHHAE